MPISPELLFWIGLAVKMVLTATAVVAVSVAVERSGPFVGALISALPTSVGAAYVILALEQPSDFIAAGAIGTVAITGAVSIFALVYTILAQRYGLIASLGAATIVWFALVYAFSLIPLDAVRRVRGLRRDLRDHYSAQLAVSHRRRTDKVCP